MNRTGLIALLLSAVPAAAYAQAAPAVEMSGGYAAAYDAKNDITLPVGWSAGAAIGFGDWFSVVADASGVHRWDEAFGAGIHLSAHTLMGGVRASGRIGRLTESGQLVAGLFHSSGTSFGVSETYNALALQPGVLLDYPVTRRAAFRGEFDVRFIASGPDGNEAGYQMRFLAGIVYRVR